MTHFIHSCVQPPVSIGKSSELIKQRRIATSTKQHTKCIVPPPSQTSTRRAPLASVNQITRAPNVRSKLAVEQVTSSAKNVRKVTAGQQVPTPTATSYRPHSGRVGAYVDTTKMTDAEFARYRTEHHVAAPRTLSNKYTDHVVVQKKYVRALGGV